MSIPTEPAASPPPWSLHAVLPYASAPRKHPLPAAQDSQASHQHSRGLPAPVQASLKRTPLPQQPRPASSHVLQNSRLSSSSSCSLFVYGSGYAELIVIT